MNPRFSVVIPTRNRPALARQSVSRLLTQTFNDFEVIILENSDSPALQDLEAIDRRIRVIPSNRVLSMPDNWERALDVVQGEYLLFISDKDMLLPFALYELDTAIRQHPGDIFTYRKAAYAWPQSKNYQGAEPETFLDFQECSGGNAIYSTKPILRSWFQQVMHYHNAPMVYNSAVSRGLILSIRSINGRFFAGNSPDVSSGAILCASTDNYVLVDRILSVGYFGSWSIGRSTWSFGRKGAAISFASEFSNDPFRSEGIAFCSSGAIAQTLLACKRAWPYLFESYSIYWPNYIANALEEFSSYRANNVNTVSETRTLFSGIGQLYSLSNFMCGISLRFSRRLRSLAPSRIWRRLRYSFPVKYILPPHLRLRRYWNNIIQRFLPMYILSLQFDLRASRQSPEFLPSYRTSHVSSLEEACHLLASCMGVTKNTCF
jgi:glycosyltransferase involved in cell wall biosynthesis